MSNEMTFSYATGASAKLHETCLWKMYSKNNQKLYFCNMTNMLKTTFITCRMEAFGIFVVDAHASFEVKLGCNQAFKP